MKAGDEEGRTYYLYIALADAYGWKVSERGFEGFKKTAHLRKKWVEQNGVNENE